MRWQQKLLNVVWTVSPAICPPLIVGSLRRTPPHHPVKTGFILTAFVFGMIWWILGIYLQLGPGITHVVSPPGH